MLGEIYRVSMIGHRVVEDYGIEEKLYELFWELLRTKEYVEFYLGRNGDFDILAASVIKRLHKNYRDDNSAMILVLPYPVKDYEYYKDYYDETSSRMNCTEYIPNGNLRNATAGWWQIQMC